jgi:3-hydroxybutyryl-CoA dehydrogenase
VDERLGIAGSGAIACGLAASASRHAEVVLLGRTDASVERALRLVGKGCSKLEGAAADRVRIVTDPRALAACSFVVEAVVEDHEAKLEVLRALARVAAPDAVLATTTSSLSIAALGAEAGVAERFVGLHVFNPVTKMKLVELAYPDAASDRTRERARALCAALGKIAVEVPDTPGFVVNRLLFPFLFSAVELLEESGMEPADVDTCMALGAGHPMGPLALLDYVGLDVAIAIGEAIGADVPQRLYDLAGDGALGKKAGRGLYDYDDAPVRQPG